MTEAATSAAGTLWYLSVSREGSDRICEARGTEPLAALLRFDGSDAAGYAASALTNMDAFQSSPSKRRTSSSASSCTTTAALPSRGAAAAGDGGPLACAACGTGDEAAPGSVAAGNDSSPSIVAADSSAAGYSEDEGYSESDSSGTDDERA